MSYANLERPYRRLTDRELSQAYVDGGPDPFLTTVEHYRALALEALLRLDKANQAFARVEPHVTLPGAPTDAP